MEAKKPIPTEYKGIRYRSKSEAMFARWLELQSYEFYYEPHLLSVGDWIPDFFAWYYHSPLDCDDGCEFVFPTFQWVVIEYKPSLPTESYCDELAKKTEILWPLIRSRFGDFAELTGGFSVFYGNVYSDIRGRIDFNGPDKNDWKDDRMWIDRRTNWIGCYEKEIANTRFDLNHGSTYHAEG